MTDGMLSVCESWTGDRPLTCPWRALYDAFVQRVLAAYEHAELGTIGLAYSHLSQRMAKGLSHYRHALNAAKAKRWEWEAEQRKRQGGQL